MVALLSPSRVPPHDPALRPRGVASAFECVAHPRARPCRGLGGLYLGAQWSRRLSLCALCECCLVLWGPLYHAFAVPGEARVAQSLHIAAEGEDGADPRGRLRVVCPASEADRLRRGTLCPDGGRWQSIRCARWFVALGRASRTLADTCRLADTQRPYRSSAGEPQMCSFDSAHISVQPSSAWTAEVEQVHASS